jgi:hypothetical protein
MDSPGTLLPVFVEMPPFERHREEYLDDDSYLLLQALLIENPVAGVVIRGTGGMRKLRFEDAQRGKGKRGGLRIIYYWWTGKHQFWLFTLYNKGEMGDLTSKEASILKGLLERELRARQMHR